MIESRDLGGTCPNRGCTPKKILVAAGHALHEIERAAVHNISVGKPRLDWGQLSRPGEGHDQGYSGQSRPGDGETGGSM